MEHLSSISIAGRTEHGLTAVKEALEDLHRDNNGASKFVVMVSDEPNTWNNQENSQDVGPLIQYWVDNRQLFSNTYFAYANLEGDSRNQMDDFATGLEEVLGAGITLPLDYPLNRNNFVFDFGNFIIEKNQGDAP